MSIPDPLGSRELRAKTRWYHLSCVDEILVSILMRGQALVASGEEARHNHRQLHSRH